MMMGVQFTGWMILVGIWDLVWKAIGIGNAAKRKHVAWAVVMVIFNTVGILPMVYMIFFRNKKKSTSAKPVAKPAAKAIRKKAVKKKKK
ncbi:MAG: hypothetical protein KKG60_00680 [Nanoarchaeota archaeon]|nr:hypothetical protein [Nanoarchaeota archaeon]